VNSDFYIIANNSLVKMNLNLLTKTSTQRCVDFVPTIAHTNTPDCHLNWQVLLIHCFTAHLEVLVSNRVTIKSYYIKTGMFARSK